MAEFDETPEEVDEDALERFRATLQDIIRRNANSGSPHGEFLREFSLQAISMLRRAEIRTAEGIPFEVVEHRLALEGDELEKLAEQYNEFVRAQSKDSAAPEAEGQ